MTADTVTSVRGGTTSPARPRRIASCDQHTRFTAGCGDCRARARSRQNERNRAIAYGTWQPTLIDATEARNHIARLHSEHGMSLRQIAELAGHSRAAIHKIAGGQSICDKNLHTAICAVQPSPPDGYRCVPITGSARRLQALTAAGYTPAHLAALLNADVQHLRDWRRAKWKQIQARHHDAIACLTDQLDGTAGPSDLARRYAAANRWVPLAAWDDIDDAAEQPNIGADTDVTVDEVLVRRAIHQPALAADMNDAEQVELTQLWRRHRMDHGETYSYKALVATFGFGEERARQLSRIASRDTSQPHPSAAERRTNRKVA